MTLSMPSNLQSLYLLVECSPWARSFNFILSEPISLATWTWLIPSIFPFVYLLTAFICFKTYFLQLHFLKSESSFKIQKKWYFLSEAIYKLPDIINCYFVENKCFICNIFFNTLSFVLFYKILDWIWETFSLHI